MNLYEFVKWSELYQLNVSHKKCGVLRLSFLRPARDVVSFKDGVPDFGVIVDSKLHCGLQCSTVVEKWQKIANSILRALSMDALSITAI